MWKPHLSWVEQLRSRILAPSEGMEENLSTLEWRAMVRFVTGRKAWDCRIWRILRRNGTDAGGWAQWWFYSLEPPLPSSNRRSIRKRERTQPCDCFLFIGFIRLGICWHSLLGMKMWRAYTHCPHSHSPWTGINAAFRFYLLGRGQDSNEYWAHTNPETGTVMPLSSISLHSHGAPRRIYRIPQFIDEETKM